MRRHAQRIGDRAGWPALSVRIAARSFAERARGFAAISASLRLAMPLERERETRLQVLLLRPRRMARRTASLPGALGKKALGDAVFERMKGHDRQSAAGLEQALGRRQCLGEFFELAVHMDAQGLEGARRRMDAALGRRPVARSTMSASARVVRIGDLSRAFSIARAMAARDALRRERQ